MAYGVPELRDYSGYAWYRRTFDVDDEWLGGELLRLGVVDYWMWEVVQYALPGR